MTLNPARWQLKNKFISILLLVLLIPATSIFVLKEIEQTLVANLKQNLMLSAKLYALQLSNNNQWFLESNLPNKEDFVAKELFVFPIQQPILLDGFFEEWQFIEKFRQQFNVLDAPSDPDSIGLLLGANAEHLYLSLQVTDATLVYPDNKNQFRSEQVVISFLDSEKLLQRLFIAPRAPGKIPVKKIVNGQPKIDWRYSAHWVETKQGFNLEMKFPAGISPTQLQVRYYDVDQKGQTSHEKVIASSLLELNPMVWPSEQLSQFVGQLQVVPGQRVWVLDTQGRVMARQGDLQALSDENLHINPILAWLFGMQADRIVDTRAQQLRLSSPIIADALADKARSAIETSAESDFALALATSSIVAEQKVIGAVLIEENIARVQLLQRKTLSQMLYLMMTIIFIVLLLVAAYVSRLVTRISKLKSQVNTLVDEQGRMIAPFELNEAQGDEVDELYTAFQQMGNKLFEYHDYLEKLASRLSHELRTPIAIVRSSLDNLLLNHQQEQDVQIIQRALDGTQRLGEIITRMRQASGVKDAMQNASFESVDLNAFIGEIVDGFRHTFTNFKFDYQGLPEGLNKDVSPDLLAELMDKLLSNAMDFSELQSPIVIQLTRNKKLLTLSVANRGPLIEKKNLRKIFQSLVSIRDGSHSQSPNLGLGLYVVKLIGEFHGAKVYAENLNDNSGVVIKVVWGNY